MPDGTVLKTKIVITRIIKKQKDEKTTDYSFDMQPILVILTEERGPPDTKQYPPQELQAAIVKDDIRYTTTSEEWNEYVVDDGTRLRIKSTLVRIAKTSKFDKNGSPQYFVELSNMATVKTPRTS